MGQFQLHFLLGTLEIDFFNRDISLSYSCIYFSPMNGTETKFNKSFLHFQPSVLYLMDINDKAAYNSHKC